MDRKSFIYSSTTLLASSLIPKTYGRIAPRELLESSANIKLKKGLSFYMIKEDLSVLDKFKLAKDLGFDGIEINTPVDVTADEFLNAKEKTGLHISSTVNKDHWSKPLSDPDSSVRDFIVNSIAKSIEQTKFLGGDTVLVVPGVVNEKVSYEVAYNNSLESIRKLIPYAEKHNVQIGLENVWNNFLLSPVEAKRFLEEINHPLVGWYFDVGNILRYGWPEHWIEALNSKIMKVHIKEFSRDIMNKQGLSKGFGVPLTEGDIKWDKVIQGLQQIKYKGEWLILELGNGDRMQLQDYSKRLDKIIALNK